jgi:putative transport protein
MLRDFGIVLFLGCVGLMSGERFVQTLVSGPGLRWIVLGAAITFPPLVVAEVIARRIIQLDYPSFCGVVAGSMTSPPVLAFANQFAGEEAAVAYGSVYPLAMVLRIISAQLLVVLWVGSGAP